MPDTALNDEDVLTSSFYTTNVREQVIATVTSSTRPTAKDGRMIYETDTEKFMVSDGTSWYDAGGDKWNSFTPSWNNLTVGNATQEARWRYEWGHIAVHGTLTWGTTTSITGNVSQTIPNSESFTTTGETEIPVGLARYTETGTATHTGDIRQATSTAVLFNVHNSSGTYVTAANIASGVPFTWGSTDVIRYSYRVPLA